MSTPAQPAITVPLLDLKAQYAPLKGRVMEAVEAIFDSQWFVNGQAVGDLEKAIASYCGCAEAVGVSSGTDALLCAMMALGIAPGDEVITTPYTFFATAGSIARLGAKPVFVDIDPATYNLDAAKIEAAITDKTKAIVPVHLFGQCADMDPILKIAQARNLLVIEDAAQAIGAEYQERRAGSMGTVGCFSFFPSKNLGGAGDGGMITTQDTGLAEKLRDFRNHGSRPKYYHQWVGGNFRLDTIQAAYLLIKLEHLDAWHVARRRNAARYDELLADIEEVRVPSLGDHNTSIYNQYAIRVPKRDKLKQHLADANVGTEIYYPLCLHEQACFADLGYKKGDFPEAEAAAAESLALPIYPELTDEQIVHVAEQIQKFFQS